MNLNLTALLFYLPLIELLVAYHLLKMMQPPRGNIANYPVTSFQCQLYRRDPERLQWLQYQRLLNADMNQHGLILREANTLLLLADCPKTAIEKVEILPGNEANFKFYFFGSPCLALQLVQVYQKGAFENALKVLGVNVIYLPDLDLFTILNSRATVPTPNLQNKHVREFLLKLLMSNDFNQFMDQVEEILKEIEEKASSTA